MKQTSWGSACFFQTKENAKIDESYVPSPNSEDRLADDLG